MLRRQFSRPHLWWLHGPDEKAVFDELCLVVEEAIALYHKDGKPLPPSTSGRDFANKMQDVAEQRDEPPAAKLVQIKGSDPH